MSIPAVTDLDTLEGLMDLAWPALETSTAQGWLLRSAGSVTQRANSVWPQTCPADLSGALTEATNWYAARRQPVIFQLTHRPENAALEDFLDGHHYSRQSETIIMTAGAGSRRQVDPEHRIVLDDAPSQEWLELWWSIDGRGGAPERAIARSIMLGAPSVYASAIDEQGRTVGTGRLALPGTDAGLGWGGIYSMAVHPALRRQGVAASIVDALLAAGSDAARSDYWLMVTAANTGAQELYGRAGFAELGRYHYRQAPLRRAPSAC
ncbi:GNAT family N-acetyltransferase [Arthrobacter sp. GMC3]|uniref:GNAT family N-acetyltransferase n=1 Tax=Arthrobacter sp. GMC3 TaxID=2058894 RepID=UPI000CE32EB3|nr:GNAT family N-acetyltransferase [Arthrobacter sp. GMC3]